MMSIHHFFAPNSIPHRLVCKRGNPFGVVVWSRKQTWLSSPVPSWLQKLHPRVTLHISEKGVRAPLHRLKKNVQIAPECILESEQDLPHQYNTFKMDDKETMHYRLALQIKWKTKNNLRNCYLKTFEAQLISSPASRCSCGAMKDFPRSLLQLHLQMTDSLEVFPHHFVLLQHHLVNISFF